MNSILHSQILGEGTPLIVLHGFLGMSDNWKTLGNKFAEHFQVHLIDQRNHGRSFHDEVFNYEVMVDDLLRYMEYHGLDQISIIGHSMGGKVAMLFAVSHPDKVDKLIIADIGPKYYPAHHEAILNGLAAVDFEKQLSRKEIENVLVDYVSEAGVRQFLLKNVYRKTKEQLAYRFNLDSLIKNYEEVGMPLPPFTNFLGKTLFLRGANSGYITDNDMILIRQQFPKADLKTVKNAGHWLHAENPTDFYDDVVRFLEV